MAGGRGVPIGVDDLGCGVILPTQGFGQKAASRVLLGRQQKIEGRAAGVHDPVAPLALDPHGGLVYPPGVVRGFKAFAQAPLQLGRVTLSPCATG
jgi:hypothetical protein